MKKLCAYVQLFECWTKAINSAGILDDGWKRGWRACLFFYFMLNKQMDFGDINMINNGNVMQKSPIASTFCSVSLI